ncbi:hypothetical protein KP509_36G063300 [Ceratopteris richardii]|uniref:Uncharacterized protein n=1 Tax=Ceratopteris richardii TaxID=49495 RepID=A0A8T2QDX0_CERRI|nr:hypothetical protein KP509_36G063300 [Ceratopteris richardii]
MAIADSTAWKFLFCLLLSFTSLNSQTLAQPIVSPADAPGNRVPFGTFAPMSSPSSAPIPPSPFQSPAQDLIPAPSSIWSPVLSPVNHSGKSPAPSPELRAAPSPLLSPSEMAPKRAISPPEKPPSEEGPSSPPAPPTSGIAPMPASSTRQRKVAPPGSVDSRGLSPGQKAGVIIGVILAAGLAFAAGVICKKRRYNIQRGEYGRGYRPEIL